MLRGSLKKSSLLRPRVRCPSLPRCTADALLLLLLELAGACSKTCKHVQVYSSFLLTTTHPTVKHGTNSEGLEQTCSGRLCCSLKQQRHLSPATRHNSGLCQPRTQSHHRCLPEPSMCHRQICCLCLASQLPAALLLLLAEA